MATKAHAVSAERLTNFTTRVFRKLGVGEEDAHITADMLVKTDLRGIDSHGVARLKAYVEGIKEGLINPKPETKLFSQAPATAIMDGDKGLGFVVGYRAMMEAMRRAEAVGTGFVTVRNSTHFGAGSNYSIMALSRNLIGISMTTGGIRMVVPGSTGGGGGINVMSVAVPTSQEAPFVLDIATTVAAVGKTEIALRKSVNIPEGWVVDKENKPIVDPSKALAEGAWLPLGGTPQLGSYKGFGLSVVVDILSSVLSGSIPCPEFPNEPNSRLKGNHFLGALNINGFMPADEFKTAMDKMVKVYRALPKAEGVDRIYLAGELEQKTEQERRSKGIPLDPVIINTLQEIAKELKIPYDL